MGDVAITFSSIDLGVNTQTILTLHAHNWSRGWEEGDEMW